MFSWLKKHFIPHDGNGHRPHLLRSTNTRKIIILVLLLEAFTFLLPTLSHINVTGQMAAVLPSVLANLTNSERESQNKSILVVNPLLNQAAEMKAKDMAQNGYFAHTSPEGKTPWYWLHLVGYEYQYAGENLAINFNDSEDVTKAWIASPTHEANLVKENYTEVGTGIASGIYEGKDTIFVAQVYANPLPESSSVSFLNPAENGGGDETSKFTNVKNVLGAEIMPISEGKEITSSPIDQSHSNPNFIERLLGSPRNSMNKILFLAGGVVFLALLSYLVFKTKNFHMDLITNGLVMLAIIGGIFSANYYLSYHNMVIAERLDYSNQHN